MRQHPRELQREISPWQTPYPRAKIPILNSHNSLLRGPQLGIPWPVHFPGQLGPKHEPEANALFAQGSLGRHSDDRLEGARAKLHEANQEPEE